MHDEGPGRRRDRVIADTGWGIKPDDQPSNAGEAGAGAVRSCQFNPAEPDAVRRLLRAQRRGFNTANRVRVEPGRTSIIDINGDAFIVHGLGFGDEPLIELLHRLGAAFDAQELRCLPPDEAGPREFNLSRAWAWGAERPG